MSCIWGTSARSSDRVSKYFVVFAAGYVFGLVVTAVRFVMNGGLR